MWKPVDPANRTAKQLRAAVWGAVMGAFVVGLTTDTLLKGPRHASDWVVLLLALILTISAAVSASPPAD